MKIDDFTLQIKEDHIPWRLFSPQDDNKKYIVLWLQGWTSSMDSHRDGVERMSEQSGLAFATLDFAGPSTYLPYLKDNKVAYFNIRLRGFGDAPVTIDVKLSVQDSENSAGVVIDAIRYLKVAKELGVVGSLRGPSAWTQKTPPEQMMYADAKAECEALANRKLTKSVLKQKTTKA